MNGKNVSQQARLAIHNGVLIPTLLCGSENWVWQGKTENRIYAVEMRSVRSMCGVFRRDRCRNSDVIERCGLKEDEVTGVEEYKARKSAAVKSATKAPQWYKIYTQGRRRKGRGVLNLRIKSFAELTHFAAQILNYSTGTDAPAAL
ncbi:hypothetical protein EVAR_859_1 [Eumeta japonica]|uniref:Uncharacterized protein n=1 Tax=Eumeta variegata TaxID=151549 RepID=A0A4C1SGK3_EUMVA|nr:hypothetical protein EVAR_859_1 [Eumeta japonica]